MKQNHQYLFCMFFLFLSVFPLINVRRGGKVSKGFSLRLSVNVYYHNDCIVLFNV